MNDGCISGSKLNFPFTDLNGQLSFYDVQNLLRMVSDRFGHILCMRRKLKLNQQSPRRVPRGRQRGKETKCDLTVIRMADLLLPVSDCELLHHFTVIQKHIKRNLEYRCNFAEGREGRIDFSALDLRNVADGHTGQSSQFFDRQVFIFFYIL